MCLNAKHFFHYWCASNPKWKYIGSNSIIYNDELYILYIGTLNLIFLHEKKVSTKYFQFKLVNIDNLFNNYSIIYHLVMWYNRDNKCI